MNNTSEQQLSAFKAIEWRNSELILLDQRQLPEAETYLSCCNASDVARAISTMVVRGAPAIGIAAAYAVVLSALQHINTEDDKKWIAAIRQDIDLLAESRPTAINLFWALEKMKSSMEMLLLDAKGNRNLFVSRLGEAAELIQQQDLQANYAMGQFGAEQITEKSAVLTHCNAGALATGGHGTALGVIRSAFSQGKLAQVYADETRPWFQGSRLTAWELAQDNIPVTLIADAAGAYLMQQKKVQWLIVGADRIAANGDVANKIGTYSAAVNANYHAVKVMVVAPCSTIDLNSESGAQIPIELRGGNELTTYAHKQIAAAETDTWNPVFDITPAGLIDVLVTERGVINDPDKKQIAQMMLPD